MSVRDDPRSTKSIDTERANWLFLHDPKINGKADLITNPEGYIHLAKK